MKPTAQDLACLNLIAADMAQKMDDAGDYGQMHRLAALLRVIARESLALVEGAAA